MSITHCNSTVCRNCHSVFIQDPNYCCHVVYILNGYKYTKKKMMFINEQVFLSIKPAFFKEKNK